MTHLTAFPAENTLQRNATDSEAHGLPLLSLRTACVLLLWQRGRWRCASWEHEGDVSS